MKAERISRPKRQSVNIYMDRAVVEEAKSLGVNISRVCDGSLRAVIKSEREARWKADNAEAVQSFNDYIEKNGIPLSQYRQF